MLTSNSSWEIIFFLMSVFLTMSAMWSLFSWISCSSLALVSRSLAVSLSKQLMTWSVASAWPESPRTSRVLVRLRTCSSLLSSRQLMRWMFSSRRTTDSLFSPHSGADPPAGDAGGGAAGGGAGDGGGGVLSDIAGWDGETGETGSDRSNGGAGGGCDW